MRKGRHTRNVTHVCRIIRLKKGDIPDAAFDAKQLRMGVKVEMEHTNDPAISKQIAKAHLVEFPDYYTRLKLMEEEAKRYWNKRR